MKTILIVEDDLLNLELLEQLLEDEYEVLTAKDGCAGVFLARREQPDLILLDMRLPRQSGWDAVRQLKSQEETKHIPVIASTASTMRGEQRKAFEVGCDDYLPKPIDEDALFRLLDKHLGASDTPNNDTHT